MLIWVISIVTLLITPLITTHEPPSRGFRFLKGFLRGFRKGFLKGFLKGLAGGFQGLGILGFRASGF